MGKPLTRRIRDYLKSDKFIHDNLVLQVDQLIGKLRKIANEKKTIDPLLLFWPAENISADDGTTITHLIMMPLSSSQEEKYKEYLTAGAKRAKAFAVAYLSSNNSEIKLIMETPAGTETWLMKKQIRGEITFVKAPVRKSDVDVLGVIEKQG